jgi:hypothetical protein
MLLTLAGYGLVFIPRFTFATTSSLGFSMEHHGMKFKQKRESWQAYNMQ